MIELAKPITTPNNNSSQFYLRTIEEATTYFRHSRLPWNDAYPELTARGMIMEAETGFRLTPSGAAAVETLHLRRPPIYQLVLGLQSGCQPQQCFQPVFCSHFWPGLTQQGFSILLLTGANKQSGHNPA